MWLNIHLGDYTLAMPQNNLTRRMYYSHIHPLRLWVNPILINSWLYPNCKDKHQTAINI